jgi:hypothetical protein
MQIPKEMVVERIRSAAGAEQVEQAERELPEKVDTERDRALLERFGVDPSQLEDGLGGHAPGVG